VTVSWLLQTASEVSFALVSHRIFVQIETIYCSTYAHERGRKEPSVICFQRGFQLGNGIA
jgi:hypothetical protein